MTPNTSAWICSAQEVLWVGADFGVDGADSWVVADGEELTLGIGGTFHGGLDSIELSVWLPFSCGKNQENSGS